VSKKVLVIGELNVDLILSGLSALPGLGQEILAAGLSLALGGSSAICAAGLARLGAQVDLVGQVGQDYYGDFIIAQLARLNIGARHVLRDSAVHTGVTVSLTFPQDRALVTHLGCTSHLRLADIDRSALQHHAHLHVGSYFLQTGLRPGLQDLFCQAHRAGLTVSLDTGWDPAEEWGREDLLTVLDQVDIFLPNEAEARAIAGVDDTEQALRALAKRTPLVVIKRGAAGAMSLLDGHIIHSPGFQVNVVDTTGTGDSFDAGFIYSYVLRGMPLEAALHFANACGALATMGIGGATAQPTLQQTQDLLNLHPLKYRRRFVPGGAGQSPGFVV